MFVIYGWLKEKRPVARLAPCYCFVCQRHRHWALLRQTEWVTLFSVRTLPFLNRYSTGCEGCGDEIPLSRQDAHHLKNAPARDIAAMVEGAQLAGKNEVQRNFLLANRSVRLTEMGEDAPS